MVEWGGRKEKEGKGRVGQSEREKETDKRDRN